MSLDNNKTFKAKVTSYFPWIMVLMDILKRYLTFKFPKVIPHLAISDKDYN